MYPDNQIEFTVSELSQAIKRAVEGGFGYVRVRGEISGWKGAHSSGHAYFRLKDQGAVLEAVCWKGTLGKVGCKPEEGLEVIASGRITTYPGSSKYQIVIERMEPAGAGALMALLEKRKAMLAAEGLFDPARKQKLPFLPEVIGIITSPTGAVIRDILHRLGDRFPVRVLVWPVAVQGQEAAQQVAEAINGFNALPLTPDILIVARGGGSLEDLWAFNEEIVVRAVAASGIPIISAIGHETDTTLIDYVADVRAPTPTAAAEMAVPVRSELILLMQEQGQRLSRCMVNGMESRRERIIGLARGLPLPSRLLEHAQQRLDDRTERLQGALPAYLQKRMQQLSVLLGKLNPGLLMQHVGRQGEEVEKFGERLFRLWQRGIADKERALTQASRLRGHDGFSQGTGARLRAGERRKWQAGEACGRDRIRQDVRRDICRWRSEGNKILKRKRAG